MYVFNGEKLQGLCIVRQHNIKIIYNMIINYVFSVRSNRFINKTTIYYINPTNLK